MPLVNLHTHSVYSDGTASPSEVLEMALKKGIRYFSLTDHDIIDGWKQLEGKMPASGLKYIYGIELSTSDHDYLHILGYGINPENENFLSKLKNYRERRLERISGILARLRALGLQVEIEEMGITRKTTFGRPHVAALLKRKKYVKSVKEAFQKYIGRGLPAYEPPRGPSAREAIEAIKSCGGLAVLAHPGVVDDFVDMGRLKEFGLDGIEAFYPSHTVSKIREYLQVAEKYSLLLTAGSDFHGPGTDRDKMFGFEYKKEYFGWMDDRFKGVL